MIFILRMPVGYSVSSEMGKTLQRLLFALHDLELFNYKADWKLKKKKRVKHTESDQKGSLRCAALGETLD